MAKLFASESAMKAADKGIQILGGYGYSRDYPLERIFRDTKLMEIGEGTSEVQRIVISKLVMSEIRADAPFSATTRYDRQEWETLLNWLSSL